MYLLSFLAPAIDGCTQDKAVVGNVRSVAQIFADFFFKFIVHATLTMQTGTIESQSAGLLTVLVETVVYLFFFSFDDYRQNENT